MIGWELHFIWNGYMDTAIGIYEESQDAIDALKDHVHVNSAVTYPRYAKSWSDNHLRIDYGARDCYYLIVPIEMEN